MCTLICKKMEDGFLMDKEASGLIRQEQEVFLESGKGTMYNNAYAFLLETGFRPGAVNRHKIKNFKTNNR